MPEPTEPTEPTEPPAGTSPPVRPARVSRRFLLAGLGGGAALTATSALAPSAVQSAATATTVTTAVDPVDPSSPAYPATVVAVGLGKKQGPRWIVERSTPSRTPGHAQYVAEPGFDGGSLWLGDSTFEIYRAPFQYAKELARRNPGLRIVYDKGNWGGGGNTYPRPNTTPTTTFAAFVPGDLTGAFSQILNADSWAAQGGTDQRQPIPGIGNYSLRLPAAAKYTPWGANSFGSSLTRGAVGIDVRPQSWFGSTSMILLTQDDTRFPDGRGTLLRIRTDGRAELRLAMDGAGANVLPAISTVPVTSVVPDGARCAVLFEFDLDKNGKSVFTPYYRVGGHGNPWKPLGAAITLNKQTGAWRGNPLVPWEVGGGGTFKGDFYEAIVRKIDRTGPDMIPRLPQQWTPTTDNMKGTMQGGRTYWMTVLAWPQHGLQDFADRTDIGKGPGLPLFVRTWNKDTPTAKNVVSPMDMVPQLPYLMTVLNSGHNETTAGSQNAQLLRSVRHKLAAQAPEAEHCVLVQNATNRNDTNSATNNGTTIFDQTNTTGLRRGHDWRIAQYAALSRSIGCEILDGRTDMVDYVRQGGSITDLLESTGEHVHPNATGALLIALGLLNQTTTTDFGTTGVLG